MAFYIDIIPAIAPDGSKTWLETDWTIDECIAEGWLDPTVPGGLWIRKMVPHEDYREDGFTTDPDRDWTDSRFGQNLGLNLVKTADGRWVHEEPDGMRLR